MADRDTIAAAVEPVATALGLALYDVEVSGPVQARTLRVTVDRDGGVDLDADPAVRAQFPGSYTLEVTSPGLERRLRTPAHFRRALGATVSVKTVVDGTGLRRRGVLVAADDDGIDVEFDTGREHLPYATVTQARTVFEWGGSPKQGAKQSA